MDLNATIVVRKLAGRAGFGVCVALAAIVVAGQVRGEGWGAGLAVVPPMGLLLLLVWCWWASATLRLTEAGIRVDNPLRWAELPWSTVDEVVPRFGLAIVAGGRRFGVWAAPARGGNTLSPVGPRGGGQQGSLPRLFGPAQTITVDLDAAQATRLVEECRLEVADPANRRRSAQGAIRTGWHWGRLALFVVLAAATILTLR